MNVWRVGIDERTGELRAAPEAVTTPAAYAKHLKFSRDGTRLAFVQGTASLTIRRVAFDPLSGAPGSYTTLVQERLLEPMGLDATAFTTTPTPDCALGYSSGGDEQPGFAWPAFQFVGAGGWLACATETIRYLDGIRTHAVLSAETTALMLAGHFGWYSYVGKNGIYYHHNGGLTTGRPSNEGVSTGVMRLTGGFDDAILLVNTSVPQIIPVMAGAFDATR